MVMVGITVLNDVSLCVDEPADLALARYIVSHSDDGDPTGWHTQRCPPH